MSTPKVTKIKDKVIGEKRITMWEQPYGKIYRITCQVSGEGKQVWYSEKYVWYADTKNSAVAEYLYNFED